jgi:hypothetical protein
MPMRQKKLNNTRTPDRVESQARVLLGHDLGPEEPSLTASTQELLEDASQGILERNVNLNGKTVKSKNATTKTEKNCANVTRRYILDNRPFKHHLH